MSTKDKFVGVRMPLALYNRLQEQATKRLLTTSSYIVHTLEVSLNEKARKSNAGSKVDPSNN